MYKNDGCLKACATIAYLPDKGIVRACGQMMGERGIQIVEKFNMKTPENAESSNHTEQKKHTVSE